MCISCSHLINETYRPSTDSGTRSEWFVWLRKEREPRARDIDVYAVRRRAVDRRIGKTDVADLQVVALLLRCYTAASQVSGDLL